MKKFIIALVLVCAFVSPVFADEFAAGKDITVGSFQSTLQDQLFEWSETPWLYLSADAIRDNRDGVTSIWTNVPTGYSFTLYGDVNGQIVEGRDNKNNLWLVPANWASDKRAGAWSVYTVYERSRKPSITGTTTFSVSPEPLSAGLFLLGGGALAIVRRRRA